MRCSPGQLKHPGWLTHHTLRCSLGHLKHPEWLTHHTFANLTECQTGLFSHFQRAGWLYGSPSCRDLMERQAVSGLQQISSSVRFPTECQTVPGLPTECQAVSGLLHNLKLCHDSYTMLTSFGIPTECRVMSELLQMSSSVSTHRECQAVSEGMKNINVTLCQDFPRYIE